MSRRKELLKNKITDNEKRRNKLNIFIHKDILTYCKSKNDNDWYYIVLLVVVSYQYLEKNSFNDSVYNWR